MFDTLKMCLSALRGYKTKKDLEWLFGDDKLITHIEDAELLSKLILRCCKENGLVTTHRLLEDCPRVLSRLEKYNPELAFRVRTGNLLGEFIILNEDMLSDIKDSLVSIREYIINHQLSGSCSIEDSKGTVVFTSYMGNDIVAYSLDGEEACTISDEGILDNFNSILEHAVVALICCIPVAVKRIRFPVEGEITRGYMFISEEKGSFEIRVD